MATWFECKVRYDKMQQDGSVKRVTEPYIVDALTFTEAEARIIKEAQPYISGEFSVSAVKRTKINEIFYDGTGDKYYLAKVAFIQIAEKGNEKKAATQYLVQAGDFDRALANIHEGMKGILGDYEVQSIAETMIMDVYKADLSGNK